MVPLKTILAYYRQGLVKLIPLKENSIDPAINWTPIYDDPNYWTDETLRMRQHLFNNIATTFGKVIINKTTYYLHCVDIDSKAILKLLRNLIEECKGKTFVVKTKKGYHIYWLSTTPNPSILAGQTKKGYQFEIKTDKSCGLAHLPPSIHRNYPQFKYTSVGKNKLMIDDALYALLTDQLKDYIIKANDAKWSDPADDADLEMGDSLYETLNDEEIDRVVEIFQPCWMLDHRHNLALRISGSFCHKYKSLESAEQWVTQIHEVARDKDPLNGRLRDVRDAYERGNHGKPVWGIPELTKYLEESVVPRLPVEQDEDGEDIVQTAKVRTESIIKKFLRVFHDSSVRIRRERETKENIIPKVISVEDLFYAPEGFYQTTGQIMSATGLYKMIENVDYSCPQCGYHGGYDCKLSLQKRPIYFSPVKDNSKCGEKDCRKDYPHSTLDVTETNIEYVDITLSDPDRFDEDRRLLAKVFREDTKHLTLNEIVTVTGYLFVERPDGNPRNKKESVLYITSLTYSQREELKLTPEIMSEVYEWAEDKRKNGIDLIQALRDIYNPLHIGDDNYKEELLMVGTSIGIKNDKTRSPQRIRSHCICIGDSGTGKTDNADWFNAIIPNSGKVAGQSASGSSLTAQIEKDNNGKYVVRQGPVAMYNNNALQIGEFNKLSTSDLKHTLDFMEEGYSDICKYTIKIRVSGNTAIVGTSNPLSGKWDEDTTVSPTKEFGLTQAVLDRVDFTQIYRDIEDEDELNKIFKLKRSAEKIHTPEKIKGYIDLQRKYLLVARTLSPTIQDEILDIMIDKFVAKAKSNGAVFSAWRMRESIKRRAIARAKLRLKNVVEIQEVQDAITGYNNYLVHLGKAIGIDKIIEDPRSITLRVIKEIGMQEESIEFYPVIHKAMNENGDAKIYLTEKGNPISLESNYRLQDIAELIRSDPEFTLTGRPLILRYKPEEKPAEVAASAAPEIMVKANNQASDVPDVPDVPDPVVLATIDKNQTASQKLSVPTQNTAQKQEIMGTAQEATSGASGASGRSNAYILKQQASQLPQSLSQENPGVVTPETTATIDSNQQLEPPKPTCPLPEKHVYVDFEWDSPRDMLDANTKMTMASFIDYKGNKKTLHIADFKAYRRPERQLLLAINNELSKYDCIIGWHTTLYTRPDNEIEDEEMEND
jgi:DNA replicative helicase MCM subunit Mcm2 (Cdc46/Mcm family)